MHNTIIVLYNTLHLKYNLYLKTLFEPTEYQGEFYNVHVPLENEDIVENVRRQLNLTRPKRTEKDKLSNNVALNNLISKAGPKVSIDDFNFLMVLGKGRYAH